MKRRPSRDCSGRQMAASSRLRSKSRRTADQGNQAAACHVHQEVEVPQEVCTQDRKLDRSLEELPLKRHAVQHHQSVAVSPTGYAAAIGRCEARARLGSR
jgi:hypothetical protein